jgi:hypothetical protein
MAAKFTYNASNGTTAIITTGTKQAVMHISGGPLGLSMTVRTGTYKVNGVKMRAEKFEKTGVVVFAAGEARTMTSDEFVIGVVASELALRASYVA